jgi:hypothetical protein
VTDDDPNESYEVMPIEPGPPHCWVANIFRRATLVASIVSSRKRYDSAPHLISDHPTEQTHCTVFSLA